MLLLMHEHFPLPLLYSVMDMCMTDQNHIHQRPNTWHTSVSLSLSLSFSGLSLPFIALLLAAVLTSY